MCILLFPQMLSAAITLPLGGYCKPGRYFPISVDGDDVGKSTLFTAQGCLPSLMEMQSKRRVIVPILATTEPRELHGGNQSFTLKIPQENERLIGTLETDASGAITSFPGCRLIPIPLQSVDFLDSPPAAWEALDGIVLTAGFARQLNDSQRSSLLAGGILLIVTGEVAPDSTWPWERVGSVWVLRCPVRGPGDGVVSEEAYTPTFAWNPGWPASLRWQVIGVGIMFVLASISILLWRSQAAIVCVFGLVIITTISIAIWQHALPKIDLAGGGIFVQHEKIFQQDNWVFERAKISSSQRVSWAGWTHPIFSSEAGLSSSNMQVELTSNGELSFNYLADANHTMAFIRRTMELEKISQPPPGHDSPMRELAKSNYLQTGDSIIGEVPGRGERWANVVISTSSFSRAP